VENDPVLRSMMTTLLEGLPGIEVVASVSGSAEALGVEQPLDVALLDWALGPDSLNGVELGRALRQRHDDIGVVILSQHYAWDFHGRRRACLQTLRSLVRFRPGSAGFSEQRW
jgi:DNA-binding NarL/FixJ family response regulator